MTPSQLLRTHGWTPRHMAVDQDNIPIDPRSASACRFCVLGAIKRIYLGRTEERVRAKVWQAVAKKYGIWGISIWNDTPGRARQEVIELLESVGE